MPDNRDCGAQGAQPGAVPRTCVPFAHVPAVPVVTVPVVPVPVPAGLPVLSVSGVLPDRTGDVDLTQFLEAWAGGFAQASATYSKSEVDGLLEAMRTGSRAVVASLASVAHPQPMVIYMVAKPASQSNSAYDEYIWTAAGAWERIGDTEIDLSNYVRKEAGKGLFSGSYNDLTNKPTIPAVDSSLSGSSTNPVQNKVVKGALDGKLGNSGGTLTGTLSFDFGGGVTARIYAEAGGPALELIGVDGKTTWFGYGGTLAYDGKAFSMPSSSGTLALASQIPDVSGKAPLASPAFTGTPTAPTAAPGTNTTQVATTAFVAGALPYSLVTPGEWQFSGEYTPSEALNVEEEEQEGSDLWYYRLYDGDTPLDNQSSLSRLSSVAFSFDNKSVTATRAYALQDRAVNAISLAAGSQSVPLALPSQNPGKVRDLYVSADNSLGSADVPMAVSSATLVDAKGASVTLSAKAGVETVYRLMERRNASSGADPVFVVSGANGSADIDPALLDEKLEATSAAPAFDPAKTYSVGEHVTYEGVLYECSTAVTTAGAWTGSTNWTATDMTSPDATLDLMAGGRLRLVSAGGDVLWMQGYGLASASSVALSCDKVNFYAFASGTVTQAFDMPSAPSGKVGDFVLDVDNTANASASATATLTGAGTAFDVFTPEGVNLSTDILTFAGGERCELYFTMTAFGTAAKPAWKVVKQIVEKQEFGS